MNTYVAGSYDRRADFEALDTVITNLESGTGADVMIFKIFLPKIQGQN
jgi:hypothetical protein